MSQNIELVPKKSKTRSMQWFGENVNQPIIGRDEMYLKIPKHNFIPNKVIVNLNVLGPCINLKVIGLAMLSIAYKNAITSFFHPKFSS